MGTVDRIRRLFRHNQADRFGVQTFSQIVACSKTPEQQDKVLRTVFHLTRLWKDGDAVHIPQVMAMVEGTYPHLERMADLEIHSAQWLAELAAATQITADSASGTVQQSEKIDQLLLLIELMKKYPMAKQNSSKVNSHGDLPAFPVHPSHCPIH
jgi:hypothetical protein